MIRRVRVADFKCFRDQYANRETVYVRPLGANHMKPEEIHPEVVQTLDRMAEVLKRTNRGAPTS